jgi:hypothetical protein
MTSARGDTASLESRPWVRRLQSPEERAAQLTAEERAVTLERRWDLAGTLGICFASCTIGVLLVGWSVHTTDDRWALPGFWAGLFAPQRELASPAPFTAP